jgi:hypothetical protein
MTRSFSKAVECFLASAGFLLLALVTALCISNQAGAGFFPPRDPILGLAMPTVFWSVGILALVCGWFALFGRAALPRAILVMWLALNAIVYQAGLVWIAGPVSFNGYWGNIAEAFRVSPNAVQLMFRAGSLYLLAGSVAVAIGLWMLQRRGGVSATREDHFKIPCCHCGGRIDFTADRVGQTLPCPHCSLTITLEKPGTLKSTCYFCKGHIEFPTHAVGTKMKCPHCRKDITLKQPGASRSAAVS